MAFTVVVLLVMRMFMLVNPQQQQVGPVNGINLHNFPSQKPPSSGIDTLPSTNSNTDTSAASVRSSCELLIQCELAIERSRMAISARCGLRPEFEELFRLSERRFGEFGACVLIEDGPSNGTEAECSESELLSIGTTTPAPESGCWRSLAGLREQCQRLQHCMVNIGTSDATMALRAQHIKINQKTLQCRQTQHPQGPTSSAAVDSSPLSETEIFSPGDTGPSPAGPPAPPVSARLHSVLTASVSPRVIVPTLGHKLRHTFALPARLNFRRLRLFAARTHRDQHKKQAVQQQLVDYHHQKQAGCACYSDTTSPSADSKLCANSGHNIASSNYSIPSAFCGYRIPLFANGISYTNDDRDGTDKNGGQRQRRVPGF
uniref:Uncharacterized protein n=1 Tax=Globodera pallida TaxID=36090 RepID=A0A183BPP2_GLOPA